MFRGLKTLRAAMTAPWGSIDIGEGGNKSICNACPEGMTCPFSSSEHNLLNGTAKNGPDFVPAIVEGYYSTKDKALQVFKCRNRIQCPGGRPNTCGGQSRYYYILLHTVTYCYILLHTVTYYYILLHTITYYYYYILLHTITYYYILWHTMTYYYILLHTITYYYILLHTITYYYHVTRLHNQSVYYLHRYWISRCISAYICTCTCVISICLSVYIYIYG